MNVGGRIGQAPYSIEDLWVRVKSRFADDEVLRSVKFYEGHQYLDAEGSPQRIVLVQDDHEVSFGAIRGGAREIGTLTDACFAHVWAVHPGKDYVGVDQGIAAKALVIEFVAAAYLSFSGMVNGGTVAVSSDTRVLKYGEHSIVSIRLRCPIEVVTQERPLHVGGAETRVSSGRHSASQFG